MFWFEFLLNPSLLEEHLLKVSPDPSATELIIKFLAVAADQKEAEKPETKPSDGDIKFPDSKNECYFRVSKKVLALRLLTLKVAAFLKWDLAILETKLPLPMQVTLIQELLILCLNRSVVEELMVNRDEKYGGPIGLLESLAKEAANLLENYKTKGRNESRVDGVALFALSLCHRWVLRAVRHNRIPTKQTRSPYIPIPGLQDAWYIAPNVVEDMMRGLEKLIPQSIDVLERIATLPASQPTESPNPLLPVYKSFTLPTEDSGDVDIMHEWNQSIVLTPQEFHCQIHYDLGAYFFFREKYSSAKEHIHGASELYSFLKSSSFQGEKSRPLFYCTVQEDVLQGYISACRLDSATKVLATNTSHSSLSGSNLLDQFFESAKNMYMGMVSILQQDNLRREIPMVHRDLLELDIVGASSSGKFTVARDLLLQVQTLNVVRRSLGDVNACVESTAHSSVTTGDYLQSIKQRPVKAAELMIAALKQILKGLTPDKKKRMKQMIMWIMEWGGDDSPERDDLEEEEEEEEGEVGPDGEAKGESASRWGLQQTLISSEEVRSFFTEDELKRLDNRWKPAQLLTKDGQVAPSLAVLDSSPWFTSSDFSGTNSAMNDPDRSTDRITIVNPSASSEKKSVLNKSDDNDDGFTHVTYKRRHHRKPIMGSAEASDEKIVGVPKKIHLHVWRLAKGTSADDLHEYIKKKTAIETEVKELTTKGVYASFRVSANNNHDRELMNHLLWPKDVSVDKFVFLKHNRALANTLSVDNQVPERDGCEGAGEAKNAQLSNNVKLVAGRLEQQVILSYNPEDIRQHLHSLLAINSVKSLIRINLKWELPISLNSVVMSIPRGFMQDFSFILLAKARELTEMKNFEEALGLLLTVQNEVRLHSGNVSGGGPFGSVVHKLHRIVSWEALLVQILQSLDQWPHIDNPQDLATRCRACLNTLCGTGGNNGSEGNVLPRLELGELCAACLLNLHDWDFLCSLDIRRCPFLDFPCALAAASRHLLKFKGAKKVSRDTWDLVIPAFGPSSSISSSNQGGSGGGGPHHHHHHHGGSGGSFHGHQHKRSSSGSTISVVHRSSSPSGLSSGSGSSGGLTRSQLILWIERLKESTVLAVLASLLARLHNVLRDEPSLELNGEYVALWPAVLSNANSYHTRAVAEMLWQLLSQALTIYPTNVGYLKLMGDLNFVMNHYAASIKYYLQAAIVVSDFFGQPIPRSVIDDTIYKRIIKCCTQLQCHTQAAVLCQFLEEVDYITAFKSLGERGGSTADASDAHLSSCIWDITLLEFLVHLHAKRGEIQRKQQAIKVIGLLELNANNNEEIQREAANIRKSRFLRAMARQYVI